MATPGTGILLVTANVGTLFDDTENLQKNWLREFYQTVHAQKPQFLSLHCQEVGGKNYEASMSHVDKLVKDLLSSDAMKEYNRARVYLDENYKSQENFTNFYIEMDSEQRSQASAAASYRLLTQEERWNILRTRLLSRYPSRENDPAFPINPTIDSSSISDSSQSQDTADDRIGKKHWCLCHCCIEMPTRVESVCCKEIEDVLGFIPDGSNCITEADMFRTIIATDQIVRVINTILHIEERPVVDAENNRRLRKTAYRSFIAWIYGYLGKDNRRVIPSCAVNIVRQLFPDPNGAYIGFMYSQDYDASEMAFH